MKKQFTITQWVQSLIRMYIEPGDVCVDATAGNGHDTLFLCQQVGISGKVFAFDIQEQAIANTSNLLGQKISFQNYDLICDSHVNMSRYIELESVDFIMFNLGYMPGGNHSISTNGETTIEAIRNGFSLLKKGGIMSVCIYSGGDSGFEEKNQVLPFLETLDEKRYTVIRCDYINRKNNPPIPVMIQKRI